MLTPRDHFAFLLGCLRQVVTARGGDASHLDTEYVWPESVSTVPRAAQSLSPLLTGSAPPWAGGASGVVTVPPGLVPPTR